MSSLIKVTNSTGEEKRPEPENTHPPPKNRWTKRRKSTSLKDLAQRKSQKRMSLKDLAQRKQITIKYTPAIYQSILTRWNPTDYNIKVNDTIVIDSSIHLSKDKTTKALSGLNSNVYIITLNDNTQFIIKQNKEDKDITSDITSEVQFQRFAASLNFAPQVYAWNQTTILMEKCRVIPQPHISYIGLKIGITFPQQSEEEKKLQSEEEKKLQSEKTAEKNKLIQELMHEERLRHLQVSINMYDATGMFIMDAHDENYVQRGQEILQIDFDDVRFSSLEQYNHWRRRFSEIFREEANDEGELRVLQYSSLVEYNIKRRKIYETTGTLLSKKFKEVNLVVTPVDPPYYYWWRNAADSSFMIKDNESKDNESKDNESKDNESKDNESNDFECEELMMTREGWISRKALYQAELEVIRLDHDNYIKGVQENRAKRIVKRVEAAQLIPIFRFFTIQVNFI